MTRGTRGQSSCHVVAPGDHENPQQLIFINLAANFRSRLFIHFASLKEIGGQIVGCPAFTANLLRLQHSIQAPLQVRYEFPAPGGATRTRECGGECGNVEMWGQS